MGGESSSIKVTLVGGGFVVTDISEARKLYSLGFFGKPVVEKKPKGPEFSSPLKLSLIEAAYLAEKGLIEVYDESGRRINVGELHEMIKGLGERAVLAYKIYKQLRDKGFIVKSGLKFGADFTVYRKGPGFEHAPFVIHVYTAREEIDPVDIIRAGRLSHSVRKTFILATEIENKVTYVIFKWFRP